MERENRKIFSLNCVFVYFKIVCFINGIKKNLVVFFFNLNIWNCIFVFYLFYNEILFFVNKVGGRYINYLYYIISFVRGMFDIKMVLVVL